MRRGDHFCQKTCGEHLNANHHGQEAEIEQRSVGHVIDVGENARTSQIQGDDKTDEESQRAPKPEEMHWAVAEFGDEIESGGEEEC